MNNIKKIVKVLLGGKLIKSIRLINNYVTDYRLYKKYSTVFRQYSFEQNESEITLRYHSIEKGLLHDKIRYRFANKRVEELISYVKKDAIYSQTTKTQINAALQNLCNYYEVHRDNKVDISDFFTMEDYSLFRKVLNNRTSSVKYHTLETYFSNTNKDFYSFSESRCSVRDFTGRTVPTDIIRQVIDLANNAPSVCNRQPVSVYVVENKKTIDKIFDIQGGLKGYSNEVAQVMILTSDRQYFYTVGERNQLYVDGGIYLMNLLYALHYYNIGACPAHWGMQVSEDKKMNNLLGLPESAQIICLLAIGIPKESFKTTLSLRRKNNENLFFVS